jgi:hypothetical protein
MDAVDGEPQRAQLVSRPPGTMPLERVAYGGVGWVEPVRREDDDARPRDTLEVRDECIPRALRQVFEHVQRAHAIERLGSEREATGIAADSLCVPSSASADPQVGEEQVEADEIRIRAQAMERTAFPTAHIQQRGTAAYGTPKEKGKTGELDDKRKT